MQDNSNQVLIIGGGRGGSAMLEMLLEEKMVHVAGIIDTIADAPGMELARAVGIPAFTNLDNALKACEPCIVFNLTGNVNVSRELEGKEHKGGVIGGVEALMMWRMVTRIKEMQKDLCHQANHDPLTGVYNRRYLMDHLEQGITEAVRYDMPYSAVMIDLDHFKLVNDTYGHAAGDAVLKGVVSCLREDLRQSDRLCRWGGEEFLVLLPHIDAPGAMLAANKWRKHVSGGPMDLGNGQSKTITFSAGVSTFDKAWMEKGAEKAMEAFLECMDNHLYRAKAAGRNRIVGTAS